MLSVPRRSPWPILRALAALLLLVAVSLPNIGCGGSQPPPPPSPPVININTGSTGNTTNTAGGGGDVIINIGTVNVSGTATGVTTGTADVQSQMAALEARINQLTLQCDALLGKVSKEDLEKLQIARAELNRARALLAEARSATDPKVRDQKLQEATQTVDEVVKIMSRIRPPGTDTTVIVDVDTSSVNGNGSTSASNGNGSTSNNNGSGSNGNGSTSNTNTSASTSNTTTSSSGSSTPTTGPVVTGWPTPPTPVSTSNQNTSGSNASGATSGDGTATSNQNTSVSNSNTTTSSGASSPTTGSPPAAR